MHSLQTLSLSALVKLSLRTLFLSPLFERSFLRCKAFFSAPQSSPSTASSRRFRAPLCNVAEKNALHSGRDRIEAGILPAFFRSTAFQPTDPGLSSLSGSGRALFDLLIQPCLLSVGPAGRFSGILLRFARTSFPGSKSHVSVRHQAGSDTDLHTLSPENMAHVSPKHKLKKQLHVLKIPAVRTDSQHTALIV